MTSWIVYSTITGACVALAALGAEWLLKSARRPVRAAWIAAIALTIALTLSAPLRSEPRAVPNMTSSFSLPEFPATVTSEPSMAQVISATTNRWLRTALKPIQVATDFASSVPASVNRSIQALSIASAVIALIVLGAVYARFMRERRKWPSVLLQGKSVRVTPNVGPAVLGLAPPEIVIPQWVLLRNAEEQRLVLEHETEHVRANDPLLLMFACVAVACMPWNAAIWFMWSRLRLAVELDCDRRVLRRGVQKPAYGRLLLELSSRRPWMSPAVPAFSWGTSHLEQRLIAMTARPERFRLLRRVASGTVIGVALLAASRAELPVPDELQAMDTSHMIARAQAAADSARPTANSIAEANLLTKAVRAFVRAADSARSSRTIKYATQDTLPRKKLSKPSDATAKPQPKRKPASALPAKVSRKYDDRMMADSASPLRKPARSTNQLVVRKNSYPKNEVLLVDTLDELTRRRREIELGSRRDAASINLFADTIVFVNAVLDSTAKAPLIRIRGQNSVSAANQPLIIIDGVVMPPDILRNIDASIIESVEVIKGAAASSLYGSRAENGAIVIKLKNL